MDMEVADVLGLLNTVSNNSYFLVEQSSCDCILRNAVAVIDLSSGDISIEANRRNLFFKLSDASCDSIIRWKNSESRRAGDWILVPVSRVWELGKYHNSIRIISAPEDPIFIVSVDACPIHDGMVRPFSLEYSIESGEYHLKQDDQSFSFRKPKLSPDEEKCLFECARGCTIRETAEIMSCSLAKVKWLRKSLMEKFYANSLYEVLAFNRLIAFLNIFDH